MNDTQEQLRQTIETAEEYRDITAADQKSIRGQLIHKMARDLKTTPHETMSLLRGVQTAYQTADCKTLFTLASESLGKDPALDEGAVEGLLDSRNISLAEMAGLPLMAKAQVLSFYAQEKIYNFGRKSHRVEGWKSLSWQQKIAHVGKYLFSKTSEDYGSPQDAWD